MARYDNDPDAKLARSMGYDTSPIKPGETHEEFISRMIRAAGALRDWTGRASMRNYVSYVRQSRHNKTVIVQTDALKRATTARSRLRAKLAAKSLLTKNGNQKFPNKFSNR